MPRVWLPQKSWKDELIERWEAACQDGSPAAAPAQPGQAGCAQETFDFG